MDDRVRNEKVIMLGFGRSRATEAKCPLTDPDKEMSEVPAGHVKPFNAAPKGAFSALSRTGSAPKRGTLSISLEEGLLRSIAHDTTAPSPNSL